MTFAELVKDLRIARELTLRQFSVEVGVDPSNWSKVERGVNPPPGDEPTLKAIAGVLGLTGEARQEFFDQAALARSELPADIASDERVLAALPAFFRAVRGGELDEAKLREFVADVRALHSPDRKTRK
ncbi:MAG: helix-turn-helix transcriptional regulator [Verrucomicrobia bacterium]|nr:helix-turn-helix transcriptional regulator [Verrucomicrobiota bacterium]